eukprot:7427251-Alexandrium_andersonii.AAC.1
MADRSDRTDSASLPRQRSVKLPQIAPGARHLNCAAPDTTSKLVPRSSGGVRSAAVRADSGSADETGSQ